MTKYALLNENGMVTRIIEATTQLPNPPPRLVLLGDYIPNIGEYWNGEEFVTTAPIMASTLSLNDTDPDDIFTAVYSTFEIARGVDYDHKLEYDLRDMEDAISTMQTGKADTAHTHTEYATTSHTHNYAATNHTHTEYAAASHTHTDFADNVHTHAQSEVTGLEAALSGKAAANHTHSNYATNEALEGKAEANHTHSNYATTDQLAGKANASHTHSDYATTEALTEGLSGKAITDHTHSEYATTTALTTGLNGKANASHTHTEYASTNHTHSQYATADDVETLETAVNGKAAANHTHTEYAPTSHIHSDYATVEDVEALEATVNGKANSSHTHAQADITGLATALSGKANSSHTHGVATTSADGFMSTADKTKLDGVATGANKTVVDSALSATSTNPVQNKVINTALTGKANATHTHTLDDVSETTSKKIMTATERTKLSGIEAEANKTVVDTALSSTSTNPVQNKVVNSALSGKANASHTHAQADVTGLADALSGKANASHTHTAAQITETTDKKVMTAAERTKLSGIAAGANAYTHPSTHPASMITGLATVATSGNYNDLSNKPTTMTPAAHTHAQSEITGLTSALNGKAATSHTHSVATSTANGFMSASDKAVFDTAKNNGQIGDCKNITVANENLDDYVESGTYTFGGSYTPIGVPAGVNGWLVVMRWATNDSSPTVKQLWYRHGTLDNNDHEIYVRTRTQGENKWSAWSKLYTTSNPPTAAEVGAAASNHNHNSAYISKDLQMTTDDGNAELQLKSGTTDNLLTKIKALGMGMHTFYSASGNAGNPKSTEAWRGIVFKTGANYGFVQAYGSIGSVYTNYLDGDTWRGWKCVFDNSPEPLWTGAYYMHSPNSTPQTVTPSKSLSECRNGWLLLWSDYDADTGTANDSDFVTTMIPKRNPSGGTWGGKSFLCDIPRYIGSDANDVSTEKRIMKPIYVHDDCIKGSYQNANSTRNDVVLRAVYEY